MITDDGVLAHNLLSPRKHVNKVYYALVDGAVADADVEAMEKGLDIGEEKVTLPAKLEILSVKIRFIGILHCIIVCYSTCFKCVCIESTI